jgi:DNA invertase Pin-like site-specific DNA recombinase
MGSVHTPVTLGWDAPRFQFGCNGLRQLAAIYFISADDPRRDTGSIKVLMAKNYVDNLSEETRKGMLEKAEQGIWPSFAPLGYRNLDGPDGKKIIAPDPDVAPIISKLFDWYATGRLFARAVLWCR